LTLLQAAVARAWHNRAPAEEVLLPALPSKEQSMNILLRSMAILALFSATVQCGADEPPDCLLRQVESHVMDQFRLFGPLSGEREYFGFIFLKDGKIASATARGGTCQWREPCEVSTRRAAAKIPAGARVLGEWHTHPRTAGSRDVSLSDVRGANANRHLPCYHAFFSTPGGDILSWNPNESDTEAAMASAVRLGSYRQPVLAEPKQVNASP
jgi:hypothetical protein